ncbi:MAG: HlyD family efflux transporter periplasmic adaptor subunit [Pyrinomonadaceae bacterium]
MINVSKKQAIYVAGAILLVLLLMWALLRGTPLSVETAVSRRGHMTVTVDGEGKTRARSKTTITAPISGKMSRIRLLEGDNIPHDYPITEIDPNPPVRRFPDKSDDLPNPYAAKVFAPVAGKVLRVFQQTEGFVAAGTPLVEIGDPANIEIIVDILSTEAIKIPPGAAINILNQNLSEPVNARVRLIEPQAITKVSALGVEEQRVNVIADFVSKSPKFGDNFRIDVSIVVWEAENVLIVPSSALFRSGDEWNVFVVESGRARKKAITAGQQNSSVTQILSGIREGETVILHPPNSLSDGTSVEAR